jgi:hypothetical protein
VFESSERLADDVRGLLESIRGVADGRYAVILDSRGIVFESAEPDTTGHWVLRRFLEQRREALFRVPAALAAGGEMEDVFAEWSSPPGEEENEFYLAFVNGRVGLVVACRNAEALQTEGEKLVHALVDRLLRYNSAWRLDEKGRGLFFGSPRLDVVVVGRPQ